MRKNDLMLEYSLFLGRPSGAFGDLRTVFVTNDDAAVSIGEQLLQHVRAVDIWRGGRRVALLKRASGALNAQGELKEP